MNQQVRTALVIGGGIAGPVTAMALRRAGIEATVFEAYATRADEKGSALSIAPNGLAALEAIGAGRLLRECGVPMTAIVLESWTGKRLAEISTPPELEPMRFVLRTELYRGLYREAERRGVEIVHGKRLVDATETSDGVTARFADGGTATADLLVGADGLRSTVRRLIDPAAPDPQYAGLLGFGALLPDSGLASTGGRMHMAFGKRCFFGLQVFADSSAVWFVNLPHRTPLTTAECARLGPEHWLPVLREAVAEDRSPALELLGRTAPEQFLTTGAVESMPRVPHWHRGRLVLVGDSAHAPSSSSGQGASLALESAVELARCVRDLPLPQALAAYEGLRRPRVERIIRNAERTNSEKAAGPVGRVLRDLLLPVLMKSAKPAKFAWQFDHRIDFTAPVSPGTAG
ncbi:monooxygenase [Streptomyces tateyamensis]|uniref:Monooxygenase n=1 Tax=Streptomyces tateyamensis TaxID=565073 RepID=A0A2V4NET6_9ACTN|nr:FAD-dependent monooxygenase [Streptomyces tateyamensis]PYC82183.1 monooxygenase [Streptomyces tateyamensis]